MQPVAAAGHPAVEWWTVGARRYETTDDLIAQAVPSPDGAVCTFHYYENPGDNDAAVLSSHVRKTTLAGAAAGAMGGAALGGVLAFGMRILEAFSFGALTFAPTLAPVLVCAGIGAFLIGGAAREEAKAYAQDGNIIDGVISKPINNLIFYPGGEVGKAVDLSTYASGSSPDWWKGKQQ